MSALLIDDGEPFELIRADLSAGMTEKWLQRVLFENPRLLPIDQMALGAGKMVPVCRELPLPKMGKNVFVDIFGVTTEGRIVIIECKLWRNPQARREVVAQIIEYAALLRRWSYADLTARLKPIFKTQVENPLYEAARLLEPNLEEARFADAVARSLRTGDFFLIVAGDGIREDMAAIAEHLAQQGSHFALVEFQHFSDRTGRSLLVPSMPFRTEVVRQRILTNIDGEPIEVVEEEAADGSPTALGEPKDAKRAENRAFWQRFIDTVEFDHPDQPRPQHGANNWVRIPLPAPARWLTAYRNKGDVGLFLSGRAHSQMFDMLAQDIDAIRAEVGLPDLRTTERSGGPNTTLAIMLDASKFDDDEALLNWFRVYSNKMVTSLRSRLSEMPPDF